MHTVSQQIGATQRKPVYLPEGGGRRTMKDRVAANRGGVRAATPLAANGEANEDSPVL
jgi:hypothetical protein